MSLTDKVTAKYPTAGSHYEVRAGKRRGRVTMFCNTTGHPIISRTWFYNGIEVQNRLNYNINHIKYTFFLGDDSKEPVKKVTFFWRIGFVLRKFITIWLKAKKKREKKTEERKFDFPSFPHLIAS